MLVSEVVGVLLSNLMLARSMHTPTNCYPLSLQLLTSQYWSLPTRSLPTVKHQGPYGGFRVWCWWLVSWGTWWWWWWWRGHEACTLPPTATWCPWQSLTSSSWWPLSLTRSSATTWSAATGSGEISDVLCSCFFSTWASMLLHSVLLLLLLRGA